MIKPLTTLLLGLLAAVSASAQPSSNVFWFDKPASYWEEALPVGNGRIGAMVFGGTDTEELQLNEETISTGGPYENWNPNGLKNLQKVRDLIFAGAYEEAQDLAEANFLSPVGEEMSYQTAGSVKIAFPARSGAVTDYRRELDLDRAVVTTRYRVDGVEYVEEVFSSFVDNLVIVRLAVSQPKALNCELSFTTPMKDTKVSVPAKNQLRLEGQGAEKGGIPGAIHYVNDLRATARGGKVAATDSTLRVEGATELLLHIAMATNFVDYRTVNADPYARNAASLKNASKKYAQALAAHVAAYQKQYGRVKLEFAPSGVPDAPINERIRDFAQTRDAQLVSLYFQFGRYLLISCSQPGTQAANLQGIWNASLMAPWCANYTTNINTEMNYWPAELTNLPELHEPLLRMIRELAVTGANTARTPERMVACGRLCFMRIRVCAGVCIIMQYRVNNYSFVQNDEKNPPTIFPGSGDFFSAGGRGLIAPDHGEELPPLFPQGRPPPGEVLPVGLPDLLHGVPRPSEQVLAEPEVFNCHHVNDLLCFTVVIIPWGTGFVNPFFHFFFSGLGLPQSLVIGFCVGLNPLVKVGQPEGRFLFPPHRIRGGGAGFCARDEGHTLGDFQLLHFLDHLFYGFIIADPSGFVKSFFQSGGGFFNPHTGGR